MSKKQLYVKYVIKSPFLLIAFILVEALIISYLLLSINIDQIITFDGKVYKGGIEIYTEQDFEMKADLIYVYINRNEHIRPVKVSGIRKIRDGYCFIVTDKKSLVYDSAEIKVDVPVGERTLLEYILTKGG